MADEFMKVDLDGFEKGLGSWIEKAEDLVGKKIPSRALLMRLGHEVADRIRKRTRLGYGVSSNGAKRVKLKNMRQHSEPYADWRAENPGKLDEETKPPMHNLTLTGEMLRDLKLTRVNMTTKQLEIGFKDPFSLKKAQINTKRGWIFMHLSDTEIKSVNNFYKREMRKLVRSFNR
jgi:hypothetical protein